jgi:predicted nucleic acid-binding protein
LITSLVVDASFIITCVLFTERGQDQVEQWVAGGYTIYAPTLLDYEVTSALTKAVHFGQLTEQKARRLLLLYQQLSIYLIEPTPQQALQAFGWTRRLQRAAAYDSFYLALAESLGCELWTSDERLANATKADWIRLANQENLP